MKVYIINWSYYSCHEGGSEIAAIYTTYELALNHVRDNFTYKKLEQEKNYKTGELLEIWRDGDYWTSISIGYLDSPILYSPKERFQTLDMINVTRAEVPGTGKTMDELRRSEEE